MRPGSGPDLFGVGSVGASSKQSMSSTYPRQQGQGQGQGNGHNQGQGQGHNQGHGQGQGQGHSQSQTPRSARSKGQDDHTARSGRSVSPTGSKNSRNSRSRVGTADTEPYDDDFETEGGLGLGHSHSGVDELSQISGGTGISLNGRERERGGLVPSSLSQHGTQQGHVSKSVSVLDTYSQSSVEPVRSHQVSEFLYYCILFLQ